MITLYAVLGDPEEPPSGRIFVTAAETLDEAIASLTAMLEGHSYFDEVDHQRDDLMTLIAQLPSDIKSSFHLLDVLGQFNVHTQNAKEFSKSTHRMDALITEIRRRNRADH